MASTKDCIVCNQQFTKSVSCSKTVWETRQFCSKSCANSRIKPNDNQPLANVVHGLNGYNLYGCRCEVCRQASRERKRQYRAGNLVPRENWGHKEETNPAWKGDDVGYKSIHDWVRRYKTKTGICTHCRKDKGTLTGHATQWANIDALYRRNLDDYIELCPSCHKRYDLVYNAGRRIKR